MSKGLSKYQKDILKRIEKEGGINVFNVAIEIGISKMLMTQANQSAIPGKLPTPTPADMLPISKMLAPPIVL
jgi:hypothetical protein